jgi:Protein of unknown function (DUF3558)
MGQVKARRVSMLATVVLLAAACSGGPAGSSGPGSSNAASGGGNGDLSNVDACALLTPAEIQQVIGVAVGAGINQDSNVVRQCEWDTTDATSGASVGITVRTFTNEDWQTVLAFPNATAVPGMGEEAYRNSPITGDLSVKKDGYEIDMAVLFAANTQAQTDQFTDSLMNLVLTRL